MLGGERLLGREVEMALVDQVLTDLPDRGGALGLYGERGLGRSALLDHAAARARTLGLAVLRAGGSIDERDAPYSTLDQTVQPVHGHVARLPQRVRDALLGIVDPRVGGSASEDEVVAWLARLVHTLVARQPFVVLVDDAELVDPSSAAALLQVMVTQWQPGAGIIVAGQQRPPAAGWHSIPAQQLQPLSAPLSRTLVTRSRPELPLGAARAVVSSSNGRPLVLCELASEASLDPSGFIQAAAAGRLPVPARLRERCASDLTGLSAHGRQTVLMAALSAAGAGRHRPVADLEAADQEVLHRAGLVTFDARGEVHFSHELARRMVVELSDSGQRRAVHELLAVDDSIDEHARASHLASASLALDSAASRSVMAAARARLSEGEAGRAIGGFLRAAALAPSADQQAPLARAAHMEATLMGRLGQADVLLRGATDRVDGRTRLRATATDVMLRFVRSGDVDTCYRLLTDALAGATASDVDEDAVVDAVEALLAVALIAGRAEYREGCLDLIDRLGITDATVVLKASLFADPLANARVVGPDIQRLLSALPAQQNPYRATHLAALGLCIPLPAQMRSTLSRLVLDVEEGGPVIPGAVALRVLSVHAFLTGEWDEVTRLTRHGVELSEANDLALHAVLCRFATALVAAGRGDAAACSASCSTISSWATPRTITYAQRAVAHVRTLAALARCDYRAAQLHARPFVGSSLAPGDLIHLMDPVEAAALKGDRDLARALVSRYRRTEVAAASPHAELLVAGSRALCAEPFDPGLYEEALAVPAAAELWFDRARIELRYGQRLRRARETVPARQHLELALDLFEGMRADPWTEQARAELLATTPGRSTSAGPARLSLTAQETRVAELAADGLTNAEIGEQLQITDRTVGAHLHHIFEKAGVRNRAMLAAALRGTGPSSDAQHVPTRPRPGAPHDLRAAGNGENHRR